MIKLIKTYWAFFRATHTYVVDQWYCRGPILRGSRRRVELDIIYSKGGWSILPPQCSLSCFHGKHIGLPTCDSSCTSIMSLEVGNSKSSPSTLHSSFVSYLAVHMCVRQLGCFWHLCAEQKGWWTWISKSQASRQNVGPLLQQFLVWSRHMGPTEIPSHVAKQDMICLDFGLPRPNLRGRATAGDQAWWLCVLLGLTSRVW